jgi:hypothetical protein
VQIGGETDVDRRAGVGNQRSKCDGDFAIRASSHFTGGAITHEL